MDGERDHLRDGWEAGDWAVVGGVLPVPALENEDCPPFEEPVVLLVPPFLQSPFYHPFDQLVHRLLDWRALLDGEGVDAVHSTCLPGSGSAEDVIKLLFGERTPPAPPSSLNHHLHSVEDLAD